MNWTDYEMSLGVFLLILTSLAPWIIAAAFWLFGEES